MDPRRQLVLFLAFRDVLGCTDPAPGVGDQLAHGVVDRDAEPAGYGLPRRAQPEPEGFRLLARDAAAGQVRHAGLEVQAERQPQSFVLGFVPDLIQRGSLENGPGFSLYAARTRVRPSRRGGASRRGGGAVLPLSLLLAPFAGRSVPSSRG